MKKETILSWIALVCLVIFFVMILFVDLPLGLGKIIGQLSGIIGLGIIIDVSVRDKYRNKFARIVLWIYIIAVLVVAISTIWFFINTFVGFMNLDNSMG